MRRCTIDGCSEKHYAHDVCKRHYRVSSAGRPITQQAEWKHKLKKAYGISVEQYTELLDKQRGVCAVCGHVCATGKRLAVDHCHKTGKVRGLLCKRCNMCIGQMEDNPMWLFAMSEYLKGC